MKGTAARNSVESSELHRELAFGLPRQRTSIMNASLYCALHLAEVEVIRHWVPDAEKQKKADVGCGGSSHDYCPPCQQHGQYKQQSSG